MKDKVLVSLCLALLGTLLTLGLWPFHAPQNQVDWIAHGNGLRFGTYGTVLSLAPFPVTNPRDSADASIEVWLEPRRIWDSGTFLAFSPFPGDPAFSLRQSQTDVTVRSEGCDAQYHCHPANLYIKNVFRSWHPVFLTVTAGRQDVSVYLDGALALTQSGFPLSARSVSGRLVLGGSPRQPDGWSGRLLGVAVYQTRLSGEQALQNYTRWTGYGMPEIAEEERLIALYTFDEHRGRLVRDHSGHGRDLIIPERYQVPDKIALEPFWTEFEMTRSYSDAVVKNVVGFIPLGLCFCAYFSRLLPGKRAAMVTVVCGASVSFAIEILQAFLPTRDSGTTDIITNTIGTWVGVMLYRARVPLVIRLLSRPPVCPRPK